MLKTINILNKRARFDYEIIEKFTAGIVLAGTEIKSIRDSKASINEGYCFVKDSEVFIKNMHIAIYEAGSYNNHDPKRDRKLLLNKTEIKNAQYIANPGCFATAIQLALLPLALNGLLKKAGLSSRVKFYESHGLSTTQRH